MRQNADYARGQLLSPFSPEKKALLLTPQAISRDCILDVHMSFSWAFLLFARRTSYTDTVHCTQPRAQQFSFAF